LQEKQLAELAVKSRPLQALLSSILAGQQTNHESTAAMQHAIEGCNSGTCQQLCPAGAAHGCHVEVCELRALQEHLVQVGRLDEVMQRPRRVVQPQVVIPTAQAQEEA
jgi:hypothetical protein